MNVGHFIPVNLESVIRKLILQWRGLLAIECTIDSNAASALTANDYIAIVTGCISLTEVNGKRLTAMSRAGLRDESVSMSI
jgi:hypothetical protein